MIWLGLMMLIIGVLTLAVRNNQNPLIGVRFSYTYLSKEAWRRANTIAGILSVILGVVVLIQSYIGASKSVVFSTFAIGMFLIAISTYSIARKAYEVETMKEEPQGEIEEMSPGFPKVIYLQWFMIPLGIAIKLPLEDIFLIAMVPVMSTIVARDPLLLRLPGKLRDIRMALYAVTLLQVAFLIYGKF
ncbi:SdpI family protein [Pyrococcus kukulkanii]|uniref:SdpI family protein n=1 Tax=Pyrococcus kukulkanii TaxID=1609559 RepID=UPI003568BB93